MLLKSFTLCFQILLLITDTMSIFEGGSKPVTEKCPPSGGTFSQSLESKEKLSEDKALVTEVENVVHEERTRIGRLSRRVTLQLARWGLEVNG